MEPPDRAADGGLGRLTRRTGRLATAALAVTTSACETHELTRQPSGGMAGRWALFWIAAIALGAVPIALFLLRAWPVPPRRIVAAMPFLAAGMATLIGVALLIGMQARRDQLTSDRGCREVPLAERPESYVVISCDESGDLGEFELVLALSFLAPASLAVLLGLVALKDKPRGLWLPGGIAAAAAVGAGWGAVGSAHDPGDGTFVGSVLVLAVSGVPAVLLLSEFFGRNRTRVPPG